ncbi:hypothetical protein ACWDRX_33370, partial [Streptomyces nigra]
MTAAESGPRGSGSAGTVRRESRRGVVVVVQQIVRGAAEAGEPDHPVGRQVLAAGRARRTARLA